MFHKKIVLVLFVAGLTCSSKLTCMQARNVVEISTATAGMISDIAAKHYEYTGNKKRSLKLHILSDVLSCSTRSLFIYNNKVARESVAGRWSWKERDVITSGIYSVRDLTKLIGHLYDLLQQDPENAEVSLNPETTQELNGLIKANPAVLEIQVPLEEIEATQEAQKKESKAAQDSSIKNKVEYTYKVILIPLLKGLSSIAMACTQDYATSYSGHEARCAATAAHSFAQLLEEHANLKEGSRLSKPLIALLCINAVWLLGEVHNYEIDNIITHGYRLWCNNCHQEAESCKTLNCLHDVCSDCLNHVVVRNFQANPGMIHDSRCPVAGCNHHRRRLERRDVKVACQNNPEIMQQFDLSVNTVPLAPLPAPEPIPWFMPPAPRPRPVDPEPAPLAHRAGNCLVCAEDGNLIILGCGHAVQCRACFRGELQGAYNGDRINMDRIQCHHDGCNHHITRNELRALAGRERFEEERHGGKVMQAARTPEEILQGYDAAVFNRANPAVGEIDEEMRALLARGEARICPGCRQGVEKEAGCNHMTCRCGQHFCYRCGAAWQAREGYNHFNIPGARCNLWDDGPLIAAPLFPAAVPVAPAAADAEAEDDWFF